MWDHANEYVTYLFLTALPREIAFNLLGDSVHSIESWVFSWKT